MELELASIWGRHVCILRIWFFDSSMRCGRRLRIINNCIWNGLDVSWSVLALIPIVVEADEQVPIIQLF